MAGKVQKPDRKSVDGTNIQIGMDLVDKEGNYIGKIKEIQEKGFLVDRSYMMLDDLFVPYWVCMHDGAEQLMLEIGRNEINPNVWRTPKQTE